MREHPIVKGTFYCSVTCQEVDAVALRTTVDFAVKGVWNPTRPPTESWVVNPAMGAERQLLRQNSAATPGPRPRPLTTEEIKAKALKIRREESARVAEVWPHRRARTPLPALDADEE